jgi:hypothetical protein
MGASPPVCQTTDGIALGEGDLDGKVYTNCTNGEVWEWKFDPMATDACPSSCPSGPLRMIATGGSRGDFIAVDRYVPSRPGGIYPSLLLTQTDTIERMGYSSPSIPFGDPDHGHGDGGWFGPPDPHRGLLILNVVFDRTNKNRLEWVPIDAASRYDVATKQGISASTAAAPAWLGVGGYFDTMDCGGASPSNGNAVVCTDTDADGLCEFDIPNDGLPAANTLDFWVVRETTGNWDEHNSESVSGVSRDTRMARDGTVVCSNATVASP